MSDDRFLDQSNSGNAACAVTKRGTRKEGKLVAVELATKYSGIDGATMGWVTLGNDLVWRDGQWHIVDEKGFADFCFAMKMPTRAIEASKGSNPSLVTIDNSSVKRSVKSQGYRVAGSGGAFPDRSLPKHIGSDKPAVAQLQGSRNVRGDALLMSPSVDRSKVDDAPSYSGQAANLMEGL